LLFRGISHRGGIHTVKSSYAIWALLVGLVVSFACPLAADEPLRYEPAVVQVSGVVVVENHYGPPNYGENPESDRVEQALILLLDMPVIVEETSDDAWEWNETHFGVARMQMVDLNDLGLWKLKWQRATIEGTLFSAHTGHHRTDVLIQVSRIVESGPIQ
jgi:hypothetical protein